MRYIYIYIYGEVGTKDEETPSTRSEVNQLMPRVHAFSKRLLKESPINVLSS